MQRVGQDPSRRWRMAVLAAAALSILAGAGCKPRGGDPHPPQPIAFDHSKHAAKGIRCIECHAGADKTDRAGLPALATCASCHYGVKPDHPEIAKVLQHHDDRRPIPWRKVNVMPATAMVHFKHKPHVRAGIECTTCHGDVATMTTARRDFEIIDMGFCIDCHRQRDASIDCLTCHH